MPRWGEHLIIANKILESNKIEINKNLFLLGNVLPDVQDGYLVTDISNIVPHEINHYDSNEKLSFENFYDKYKTQMDNPLILGYFTHLMTDYIWNKKFEEKWIIDKDNNFIGYYNSSKQIIRKNKEEARKDKQKDFEIFESYIFDKLQFDIPKYEDNLIENCNLIETIKINEEDIKSVLRYITDLKHNLISNEKLKIFKQKELEEYINYSTKYILDYINNF